VNRVLDALEDVGHAELKNTGTFTLPGFVKSPQEKAATEAHQGCRGRRHVVPVELSQRPIR
jgi:hypothetical protein